MKASFEVIKEVKVRVKGGELVCVAPGGIISIEPEKAETFVRDGKLKPVAEVENLTPEQFSKTNLAMKVESSVLNEVICFASNESVVAELRNQGFVCYTAKELEALTRKQFHPEELKKIYEIKTVFPGCSIIQ